MSKRVALPRAIRALREARAKYDPANYSASKVATNAFMSPSHLSNIESGRRLATPESIALLAAALDVEIDAISYTIESEALTA